ncbi:MAG TPA: bifunctional riboflavin kinase/FAD synthetase [Gammaproteobacteria bacterium]|jgi:riboflavin kinase/FMN adenylyltransferase|nr:bifunctional riboflavin kinase/FMN adenylyltransferase [Gammaproteobacteria bacterium]MBQ09784.1 bifunctional riboflavin kinase/FMN adenylyltransferase [Gammaproteobacteria bacterium]HJL79688.1 bifunctional riboflavin kinase/FAD synthetase [Gammaproteobacteria bacterium]HJN00796.1 bifunctional riboflavin kinase/FAD synthetase [Gammaproteobacteria bacterium]|tara:strand:- start:20188 stop:21126 length:939 start_codon:yes stop_codon:yes gene_type:complete
MKIARSINSDTNEFPNGSSVCIGVFDGIHLGHQELIKKTTEYAKENGLSSVLFTFEPSPNEYFSKGEPQPRLTTAEEKHRYLSNSHIDFLYCPPFDQEMENLSPVQFITRHLIAKLNAKHVVVGVDFHFAKNRSGSVQTLIENGHEYGFDIDPIEFITQRDKKISSTAIRQSLINQDIEIANQMLGRNYSVLGQVMEGNQIGRTIGFPTANIDISKRDILLRGVFCVKAIIGSGEKECNGLANIGFKPTVNGTALTLEVHLLNFDKDIYGSTLEIYFMHRVRGEKKFNNLDELAVQINEDVKKADEFFATNQ